jgi:hypothetical protein
VEEESLFLDPKRFNSVEIILWRGGWDGAKAVVVVAVRRRVAIVVSFVMVTELEKEAKNRRCGASPRGTSFMWNLGKLNLPLKIPCDDRMCDVQSRFF